LVGDGLFVGGFCGVLLLFFGLLDCFFVGDGLLFLVLFFYLAASCG
jgi:hypothetical protein